jgi:hypothetical protein
VIVEPLPDSGIERLQIGRGVGNFDRFLPLLVQIANFNPGSNADKERYLV